MRRPRYLSLPLLLLWLAAPLLAGAALSTQRQAQQVFLFPPPPVRPGHPVPTLSGAQAQTVIEHHLGSSLADVEVPEHHGLWGHFMGWWEGSKRPRVVIVETPQVQHVFSNDAPKPTFYLEADDTSVLDPYLKAARDALERILELPPVKTLLDTLDLAVTDASKAIAQELAALVALADNLWTEASDKWDAVALHLDAAVEGSELWDQATKVVQAGIASMTQPDAGPVVLVVMSGAQGRHYAREPAAAAAAERRQVQTASQAPENGGMRAAATVDYSSQFAVIAGTTLVLVIAAVASISLLFSIGDESLPSSLNLAPL